MSMRLATPDAPGGALDVAVAVSAAVSGTEEGRGTAASSTPPGAAGVANLIDIRNSSTQKK